jgi:hypothetical protein
MHSSQLLQHKAAGNSSSSEGALQARQLAAAAKLLQQMTFRTAQPSSSSSRCTHDLHRCRVACTRQV